MKPGSLYCEQCGEDIHIVPDFEPEVDFNMQETIIQIADEIKEQDTTIPVSVQKKTTGKFKKWIFPVVAGFLAVAIIVCTVTATRYYSADVQLSMARKLTEAGKYDQSISCYQRVQQLTDQDIVSIKFELADVYFRKNNKMEYEYMLRDIIGDASSTGEQLESAYGKLIAIYRAREDYQSINELLLSCKEENVLNTYKDYIASAPEFSIQEGYYADIQPLKLTSFGTGKIYYTLDGSSPTTASAVYTAPIILEDGDYTVKALFVNAYGVVSDCVTKEYHIEMEALSVPEVSTVSGEYQFPVNIEISGNSEDVYYTTDGTKPTLSSTVYSGSFPMPLGKSTFKFIRISDGRESEVVERTYSLVMNTEYTPEDGLTDLVAYFIQSGKIYDESGHFNDSKERYVYQYQYVTNIDKIDDFYVYSEIFCNEDGEPTKTGSYYAVNAYTGKLYKLQIENRNNYTLVGIEEQPEE